MHTAWKVSIFGAFLVRIFRHLDLIQNDTRSFSINVTHYVQVQLMFAKTDFIKISNSWLQNARRKNNVDKKLLQDQGVITMINQHYFHPLCPPTVFISLVIVLIKNIPIFITLGSGVVILHTKNTFSKSIVWFSSYQTPPAIPTTVPVWMVIKTYMLGL